MPTWSMNLYVAVCGSFRLGRCRVRRKLWLQVWYLNAPMLGGGGLFLWDWLVWHILLRLCTYTHSKTLKADQSPVEKKKFWKIRRICQPNQSRKITPSPQHRSIKVPHLQSQFPPNFIPTQPERSTPFYLQIHWPNRHPTKFSLIEARKIMMRSEHHHAV